METNPSICIPRAKMIQSREVKTILEKLFGTATIDRIDVVPYKDVAEYCKIFIHMKYWPEDNNEVSNLKKALMNGNCINIVYLNPQSGLRGDAPQSGLRGDAPQSGLRGDAPQSGLRGDAPYFWKCFMSRLPKPNY